MEFQYNISHRFPENIRRMHPHFKIISQVFEETKTDAPQAIWQALCETYLMQTSSPGFYTCRPDYMELARLFKDKTPAEHEKNFFSSNINAYFNNRQLNPEGQFAGMLQMFLICYPEYLTGLNLGITDNLPKIKTDSSDLAEIYNFMTGADDSHWTDYFIRRLRTPASPQTNAEVSKQINIEIKIINILTKNATLISAMNKSVVASLLISKLNADDDYLKKAAITALKEFADSISVEQSSEVSDFCIELLEEDYSDKKAEALHILSKIFIYIPESKKGNLLSIHSKSDNKREKTITLIMKFLDVKKKDRDGKEEYKREVALSAFQGINHLIPENIKTELTIKYILNLSSPDVTVREYAIKNLGDLAIYIPKGRYEEVINILLTNLGDPDRNIRIAALKAIPRLVNFVPDQIRASLFDALILLIADDSNEVGKIALKFLSKFFALIKVAKQSMIVTALLANLFDPKWDKRDIGLDYLREFSVGKEAEVLAICVSKLNDDNWYVKVSALSAISKFAAFLPVEKYAKAEIISQIIEKLNDADSSVRRDACDTLKSISRFLADERENFNKLFITKLDDSDTTVINWILKNLGEYNSNIPEGKKTEILNAALKNLRSQGVDGIDAHSIVIHLFPYVSYFKMIEIIDHLIRLAKNDSYDGRDTISTLSHLYPLMTDNIKTWVFNTMLGIVNSCCANYTAFTTIKKHIDEISKIKQIEVATVLVKRMEYAGQSVREYMDTIIDISDKMTQSQKNHFIFGVLFPMLSNNKNKEIHYELIEIIGRIRENMIVYRHLLASMKEEDVVKITISYLRQLR